jgi:hypothetical protein
MDFALHKGEQFTPELIWPLRMAIRRDQAAKA